MLTRIQNSSGNDAVVEEVRSYLVGNWDAIYRAFRDKHVLVVWKDTSAMSMLNG